MDIPETKLSPPEEFPFPFIPYFIQKDLMRSLYETLEDKKLGIFESPTGTGKSMSLICGSLQWLFDAQKRTKEDLEINLEEHNRVVNNSSLGSNWIEDHSTLAKNKQTRDKLKNILDGFKKMEERIEEIQLRAQKLDQKPLHFKSKKNIKKKTDVLEDSSNNRVEINKDYDDDDDDNDDVLLDEYTMYEEGDIFDEKSSDSEAEMNTEYNGIKVFLCSRTHSQLSQLIKEIEKSPYKNLKVRVVSLASRQNYCINESVLKLKHPSLINEKCLDLHNSKKNKTTKKTKTGKSLKRQKTESGCPFYNLANIEKIKMKILTEIQDVEQLVQLGREWEGCPYYASRHAINDAQVVVVPYNTILHTSTRVACGIQLKDSVVIIDEAHNLLDAIANIYSSVAGGQELISSHSHLLQYKSKYGDRLSPLNLLHLNQLIFIVNKLIKKVSGKDGAESDVSVETLSEFVTSCEIDTVNLHRIIEFVSKSNIINKVRGFVDKCKPSVVIHKKEDKGVAAFLKNLSTKKDVTVEEDQPEEQECAKANSLLNVVNFVRSLTNHCLDGRVVCIRGKTIGSSCLKFLLLNPASHFGDIVREARSVVLAGGTMKPMSEFTDQLFYLAGGTPDRISTFTCGHIVPKENILPIILSAGPSGKPLEFSYQQRSNTEMLDELGRLFVNVCNVVPAGVVCFFSSYDFENFVFRHLEKTKIIDKLETKKRVLREPKKSTEVDKVLSQYSLEVKNRGALLFSVVGGKLSEGLNFNDDLGRCVIVVGLPYPNINSPELKEKMSYLDEKVGVGAGKAYYEGLCMKAVNQSIGRSVRHKDDYACVLLVDQRYGKPRYVKALPDWIRNSLRIESKFGPVVGLLAKFFASKKK